MLLIHFPHSNYLESAQTFKLVWIAYANHHKVRWIMGYFMYNFFFIYWTQIYCLLLLWIGIKKKNKEVHGFDIIWCLVLWIVARKKIDRYSKKIITTAAGLEPARAEPKRYLDGFKSFSLTTRTYRQKIEIFYLPLKSSVLKF